MSTNTPILRRLRQIVEGPEARVDLAAAALVVAQQEYPDLEVAQWLARFDAMAQELALELDPGHNAPQAILALNRFLFDRYGFYGNTEDYYDPRNSFLNEVLERRTGIPITLSIVYMEVGRRIGLPLEGVSFPGHFLVACSVQGGRVILDPFSGGVSLGRKDLERRLRLVQGNGTTGRTGLGQFLKPAGKKGILVRLLRNLKGIYLSNGDLQRALGVIEQILVVKPDLAQEVRDRGLILQKMECFRGALADLERYLRLEPDAPDGEAIHRQIVGLQKAAASLN